MEQQSLFDAIAPDSGRNFWTLWEPILTAACESKGFPASCISGRKTRSGYISVLFANSVIAQIRSSRNSEYVVVQCPLPNDTPILRETGGRLKIEFETALRPNVASAIIVAAIRALPKTYDCCSAYMECSDARRCVKMSASALGCGYRRALSEGRIFYGKNRNVDG